ncbi:MAG: hypothetical protein KGH57_00640 [Candidatus Micrarchaeota archaeon]|nr:hypothetical protein [Candidatus Micrarchaeota archaeon]
MNNTTRMLAVFLASLVLSTTIVSAQSITAALSSELCGIVNNIRAIVGILALALFLIGGVMYAVGHFLPTSLDYRKSLLGWATAMITGGVIGLIVVLLAPFIVGLVTGLGQTAAGSSINLLSC